MINPGGIEGRFDSLDNNNASKISSLIFPQGPDLAGYYGDIDAIFEKR